MKNKKVILGLSLVEILIVVAIVATLVLTAFFLARNQVSKARDSRRKGDIFKISQAVEEYEKDNNCYPDSSLVVCDPGTGLTPYLQTIPCDPKTKNSYAYETDGSLTCHKWYRIYSVLENIGDNNYLTNIGPGGAYNYYAGSPNAPSPSPVASSSPSSTITPSPSPTASPDPGSGFYGCRSGVCVPILWNPARPGPECDPNYQSSDCYEQCGVPANECVTW